MRYPEYPEYEDSDVPWIGRLPKGWSALRLKFLGDTILGLTYAPEEITDEQNGTLVLRANNIQDRQLVANDPVYVSAEAPEKLKLQEGDILICSRNGSRHLIGKCGRVTSEFVGCYFGAFNTVFRSQENDYMFYVLNSSLFEFQSGSYLTSTINQLTIGALNSFMIPLPSSNEQQRIAAFLDWKTGQIDALIAKKKELLEKLKEKRLAVITQAVTKDLPSTGSGQATATMKDSGIPWLGQVPEHWEVKRARFVMQVNPSAPRLRSLTSEDEVSFIPMDAVGVQGGLSLEQTRVLADTSGGYTEFQDGDVVVAKITPCFENGKAALANGLMNGAAFGTTELHVLRADATLDQRFLFYVAISDTFHKLGESEMYGAGGQKRVPPEFINDFRLSLPPLTEQAAIAEYLIEVTGKIDLMMNKTEFAIDRLTEYRTALILLCHKRSLELIQLQCGQKPSSPTSATLKCKRNEVIESGT